MSRPWRVSRCFIEGGSTGEGQHAGTSGTGIENWQNGKGGQLRGEEAGKLLFPYMGGVLMKDLAPSDVLSAVQVPERVGYS